MRQPADDPLEVGRPWRCSTTQAETVEAIGGCEDTPQLNLAGKLEERLLDAEGEQVAAVVARPLVGLLQGRASPYFKARD